MRKELKTKQIFEIVEMSYKKEKNTEKSLVQVQCIMSAHTVFKLLHLNYVNTFTC